MDKDGDMDLVSHFPTEGLLLGAGDVSALLTGETFDGMGVEGTDSVRVKDSR